MHRNITPRRFYPMPKPHKPIPPPEPDFGLSDIPLKHAIPLPHELAPLGQLLITPDAKAKIPDWEITEAITRHARGDHGFMERVNDEDPDIYSLFETEETGQRFFILTEPSLKTTTVFLYEEW